MKTCTKCGISKPMADFYKHKSTKDGYRPECKSCWCIRTGQRQKKYKAEHPDEVKIRAAKYRVKNSDKIKEQHRKYRASNPDKVKQRSDIFHASNKEKEKLYGAKYRVAHKDKIKASASKWRTNNLEKAKSARVERYAKNPEKERDSSRAWKSTNKDRIRIYSLNRRARERENGGKLSQGLAERLYKLQKGKCACGCKQNLGDDYHMDHIMPIKLGGSNTDENIQLLRAVCNYKKSAYHPVDFMQSRGFLI
ncbi:MAG: HNH endonuclease [Thiobacillus sp.]